MANYLFMLASACQDVTGAVCQTGLPTAAANRGNLRSLLQVAFGILGALAVLMIIIGALNFIMSEGDAQKAANARNTMVYSLVGLVIAMSAEAIVALTLGGF